MQFRTKARAVDLLGKGQIADLPTAITELWKNGYDAYADNLTAEIYLENIEDNNSSLFIMTDDGKGMSQSDILDKWLVLGTDSKSRALLEEESQETLWKKPRIKSGEKGIGRLSIAFLGCPMLMLTKKQGHPLQALFFDWRLLENYNLFLDDIEIPVESVRDSENFKEVFKSLKISFFKNFKKENDEDGNPIWESKQSDLKEKIKKSVNEAALPEFLVKKLLKDIVDIENDNGTKFIIFEPIDQIINLTKINDDSIEDKQFVISSLSGFINEFKEERKKITTKIPIFKEVNNSYDFLTSEGNFFDNKDYDYADVLIDGIFDGKGSFKGKLKIYDEEIDYTYTNPRKKIKKHEYGKFPIKLGYSQGNQSESKLNETAWKKINDKVINYGGLYIYRDDFRVLPYGRTDFDFLGFEKRRAKRAGSFYFSHRRMFGYVGLKRAINEELRDKSSREGLINNAPYRAFKNDLEAFFIELANEYFSDSANKSIFLDKKEKLKAQTEEIKKDKKRETAEKIEFSKSLKEYPKKFDDYQTQYKKLLALLKEKTEVANVLYSDIEDVLDKLKTLDIEYQQLLPKIPKRYKPTETQLDRLAKYEEKLSTFNNTIKSNSVNLMAKVEQKLQVKELAIEFSKHFQKFNGELERLIGDNRLKLKSRFDHFELTPNH